MTRRSQRGAATLVWMLVWLALIAGTTWALQRWLSPPPLAVTAQGDWLIPRGSDGHYHVPGTVGGQPVRFLVDTGASLVVVTEALAQRAGLPPGEPVTFQTAAGDSPGRIVPGMPVALTGPQGQSRTVSRVRVGVGLVGASDDDALLGQSFLRHFDVQIKDGVMRLTAR
ncbi:retropepsin-like aspartic protease family protein [Amphibiibacter pelophylacis]|uniref:Retropepsin-like aspartic protease n=1 Tax=Amphibiibacter pelophylacis TaxID=1799477 RepID=A0ACC6NZX2_9BURK